MRTDQLDYELPQELIADRPADRREQARLLLARLESDTTEHRTVAELPDLLRTGDLLVLNDTRVVPARFFGRRANTGGRVEGLFLETVDEATWRLMLGARGKLRPGERIELDPGHELELLEREGGGVWRAGLHGPEPTGALLERIGTMPLPPYIRRRREAGVEDEWDPLDRQRYQTVYAHKPGAIAAPTAGLHFTDTLFDRLRHAGVELAWLTLHVGPGTFAPVRAERIEDHSMHSERFTVPAETLAAVRRARQENRRIIPVGTTSVRALESLPPDVRDDRDYSAATDLLIQPGFRFRYTDGLMTNFHLPRSTLLALVAARTGLERLKRLYAEAIEQRYRFYSYGDAMLLLPE